MKRFCRQFVHYFYWSLHLTEAKRLKYSYKVPALIVMVSEKVSKYIDYIIDKSWDLQYLIEEKFKGMGSGEYGRVIKMARKPEYDEYMKTCAITGAGILLIGALGFAIYYAWVHLPDYMSDLLGL